MPGSLTTPGRPGARADAPEYVAFHHMHGVGTQNRKLSRLNGWRMRPPVNASLRPSRATAHDSGPMWIATPSSQGSCTLYSLPVSRRVAILVCNALESGLKQLVFRFAENIVRLNAEPLWTGQSPSPSFWPRSHSIPPSPRITPAMCRPMRWSRTGCHGTRLNPSPSSIMA